MDRNLKYQVGQQFKRANDVEVSTGFKQKVELIALSHLAVGNSSDYMLAMNSLAKTNAKTEIEEIKAMLGDILSGKANVNQGPEGV